MAYEYCVVCDEGIRVGLCTVKWIGPGKERSWVMYYCSIRLRDGENSQETAVTIAATGIRTWFLWKRTHPL